jgi:hypothetical protein
MKRLTFLLLFLTLAVPAHAFTAAADHRIALKGADLGPPDLNLVIQQFRNEYLRGVDTAPAVDRSKLRASIEAEALGIIKMIRTNKPMVAIVEHLGMLARMVSDANNPMAGHDDFAHFVETRLSRIPTVYYGVDKRFVLGAYLDRTLARTAKFVPLMDEEYTRGSSATFDDRSTAFGVASVCYSHAVTDVANLQVFIWKQAGGNVRNVPQSVVLNGN